MRGRAVEVRWERIWNVRTFLSTASCRLQWSLRKYSLTFNLRLIHAEVGGLLLPIKIQKWLNDDYHWLFRLRMKLAAFVHNRLPRSFRIFPALHWTARGALVSSAPAATAFYGTIEWATAGIASLGIAGLYSCTSVLSQLSNSPQQRSQMMQAETIVRFGDLLTTYRQGAIRTSDTDDAIRSCLGILENFCLNSVKREKGAISVSVVMYMGSSTKRMKIKHRNPGNERPINREIASDILLGHHACQHGPEPQVIHHVGHFGRNIKSPTQPQPAYKSIYVIPLEVADGSGNARICGFVSIDCKYPYAFFGNRSAEIIVTCEPIIGQIRELVRGGSNGRAGKR